MAIRIFKTIKSVKPIGMGRNAVVRCKKDLRKIVEEPLLGACEILYDRNIQTMESSANYQDISRGFCSVAINYDSLSDENKKIALENFGKSIKSGDGFNLILIKIPINNADMKVKELSDKAIVEADKFKLQPLNWINVFTFKQILKIWGIKEDPELKPEDFSDRHYFYDRELDLFFFSEEHSQKVKGSMSRRQLIEFVTKAKSRIRVIS